MIHAFIMRLGVNLSCVRTVDPKEADTGEDIRGFWGNTFTGENIDSKLWLLKRSKLTQTTLNLAR